MLKDGGYSDDLLEEFNEIASYLAYFAENASSMLESGDEDGLASLMTSSCIDLYDYRRGKPLAVPENEPEDGQNDPPEHVPLRKMNGWTLY